MDSSIYGALVRLSQPWSLRYPLIDFHGSNGNIDGDGPAAYRYTEARLAKIAEDGMLSNIKKSTVNFIPNYSETKDEPIELPSLFPNLLCNPNSGIGVSLACSWAPHNLKEVAQAIYDYMDGKEPMLPGPDFPTGGLIINKNDIPSIMKTGHGSVKLRARYKIEGTNIVFIEIPYGTNTESIMSQIGDLCDSGDINGIEDIRNESNKKGFRLVVECSKNASIQTTLNKLYAKTSLQTSFSYNQVALVNKVPTELNLKQCIKIYIDFNIKCIQNETLFDKNKAESKLHIIEGLLRALEDIDNIIALIKNSKSSAEAKINLVNKYSFTESQADAIVNMKLGRLAGLEKIELNEEKNELIQEINHLTWILENTSTELRNRLTDLVNKYGDDRRTELAQLDAPKEEKEIEFVEPEKCVVIMTEDGYIKRIPSASFKPQRRNGKGIKKIGDIISATIKTNTIDNLMIFTNKGKMYRVLVNNIPVGTNTTKGTLISSLIQMDTNETPQMIYSIYRETEAKYVFFATKNGIIKKTPLDEYINTKKRNGIAAISFKENDSLAAVGLVSTEDMLLMTHNGKCIKFSLNEVPISSRTAQGVKGMALDEDDYIVSALPIRHSSDALAIFTEDGIGKKVDLTEFPRQKRGGKGLIASKNVISCGTLVSDEDFVLISGIENSICISATDIPIMGRAAAGNIMIKGKIKSVTKV